MSNPARAGSETVQLSEVRKIVKGTLAAADELMTEFVSKKRAADWKVINDGLYAAGRFLRETGPTVRQ